MRNFFVYKYLEFNSTNEYRENFFRDINAAWQPYSIIDLNKFDKPLNSTNNMFFIGGYDWDGSLLYMTPDQRIHFCSSENSKSLMSWDSLYSMLVSEIERLYLLQKEFK